MTTTTTGTFILWIAFGILTTIEAQKQGKSVLLWLGLGLLFGPLAWITVRRGTGYVCPYCKKDIDKTASICPHCRSVLAPVK